jgi:SOS-response transcriptional repressor LexA
MPHALTERQKEFLTFIQEYVRENQMSPRLDEIASRFQVKPPTAHKMLKALSKKGFLYFGRDSKSGFFIRLIERAGSAETVTEIPIAGKVNALGEVYDFPENYGHFATLLIGSRPGELFALGVIEDIPQAAMESHDLIIFDQGKHPQPGDICIVPIGERYFLSQIVSKTLDKDLTSLEVSNKYPVPEELEDMDLGKKLNWYPIAYDDDTHDLFVEILREQDWNMAEIPTDFVVATALRLTRTLAF